MSKLIGQPKLSKLKNKNLSLKSTSDQAFVEALGTESFEVSITGNKFHPV